MIAFRNLDSKERKVRFQAFALMWAEEIGLSQLSCMPTASSTPMQSGISCELGHENKPVLSWVYGAEIVKNGNKIKDVNYLKVVAIVEAGF